MKFSYIANNYIAEIGQTTFRYPATGLFKWSILVYIPTTSPMTLSTVESLSGVPKIPLGYTSISIESILWGLIPQTTDSNTKRLGKRQRPLLGTIDARGHH